MAVKKMMQKNINQQAQSKRRKAAFQSAIISSLMLLLASLTKLGLRWYYQMNDFWGALLHIFAILELAMLVPIWILLSTRLKDIEGGEEDVATQY